jgi:hypothetical protein
MLAVNGRFQRWLGMCEGATVSRSQVKDRVLQFDSLVEDILSGQFNMTLPATFKKIQGNPRSHEDTGKGQPERDNVGRRGSSTRSSPAQLLETTINTTSSK